MIRRLALLLSLSIAVGVAAGAPASLAVFTSARTSSATFGTATIAPPTSLAGTGGAQSTLSWIASTTAAATGYAVLRSATSGGGYGQVGTVTPVSATTTTDKPAAGTWFYVLRTYLGTWTSVVSNQAQVVVGAPTSSGLKHCTSSAPETTASGNNDGYELNPGNACAQDGVSATDAKSGTNSVNSCTDAGKDRHRWWGYSFGLPAAVTSIDGITLQAVVGLNNNGGTSVLCAQLSWDGGTTWTAAKSVALAGTGPTTYTMGGTADTWGHAWTPAQLGTASLQVRITDVSTQPDKDFRLDDLGLTAQYTP